MDQHPIPQDVTGFQFKLIGTMTVKQFGYIAIGGIFAVIAWYAPVQGFILQAITKGLLLPIFGVSGVIVAFVPIDGRPIDVMAVNFMHALLSPNQYIYIKAGRKFSFTQISIVKPAVAQNTARKHKTQIGIDDKKEQQLRALLTGGYKDAKNSLDKKELAFLQSFTPVARPYEAGDPSKRIAPVRRQPATIPQPKMPNIQIEQTPKPEAHNMLSTLPALPKTSLPQVQVATNDSYTVKPGATANTTRMQAIAQNTQPAPMTTIQPKLTAVRNITNVEIPQSMTKNTSLSNVSDTPNVIIGTVKDPRGNLLPNILVEIKDKDGMPVRAFKTNPFGQFASATPLADGNYTIELEDPKKLHAFDSMSINTKGEIMFPIEITSHDAREELRKALFN